MAISINWPLGIIHIPKNDLILVQSSPTEIWNMDLNWFRLQLKSLEDSDEGITWPKTHNHNTEVILSGVTYARIIEVLEPYTITFEDGQYAVNLIGANSNVADRVNVNQVSVRSANSAGLITVVSGSGVTEQDKEEIISGVWNAILSGYTYPGSTGEALSQAMSGGNPQDIKDAVWNALLEDYTISRTFGDHLRKIKNNKI